MTQHADADRGRDVVARWCNLAEQRLEHLTELFESGRWRRYHNEIAFLQNIQEAKAAVETWRALVKGKTSLNQSATAIRPAATRPTPREDISLKSFEPAPRLQPEPAPIAAAPPRHVLVALESQLAALGETPPLADAPALDDMPLPQLNLDVMQKRYPLLRNAL